MKTCPVCNARAFDDMDVCYGCLHRFDEAPKDTPGLSAAPLKTDGEERLRDAGGRRPPAAGGDVGEPKATPLGESGREGGGKTIVINVPVPEGAKGVRVAVDFSIDGDPHESACLRENASR